MKNKLIERKKYPGLVIFENGVLMHTDGQKCKNYSGKYCESWTDLYCHLRIGWENKIDRAGVPYTESLCHAGCKFFKIKNGTVTRSCSRNRNRAGGDTSCYNKFPIMESEWFLDLRTENSQWERHDDTGAVIETRSKFPYAREPKTYRFINGEKYQYGACNYGD